MTGTAVRWLIAVAAVAIGITAYMRSREQHGPSPTALPLREESQTTLVRIRLCTVGCTVTYKLAHQYRELAQGPSYEQAQSWRVDARVRAAFGEALSGGACKLTLTFLQVKVYQDSGGVWSDMSGAVFVASLSREGYVERVDREGPGKSIHPSLVQRWLGVTASEDEVPPSRKWIGDANRLSQVFNSGSNSLQPYAGTCSYELLAVRSSADDTVAEVSRLWTLNEVKGPTDKRSQRDEARVHWSVRRGIPLQVQGSRNCARSVETNLEDGHHLDKYESSEEFTLEVVPE